MRIGKNTLRKKLILSSTCDYIFFILNTSFCFVFSENIYLCFSSYFYYVGIACYVVFLRKK